MNIKELRKSIRAQRRQLSQQTLLSHSQQMMRLAKSCRWFLHSKRIAFYFAADGEMDPEPLLAFANASKKLCYFPVLRERPSHALWFALLKSNNNTAINRFGIPEPAAYHRHIIMPWGLDLIFLPLVSFDIAGNRLGMGGGYYDRTLSFKHNRSYWRGPKLIGLAHELQRTDALNRNQWDIPLDAVITEKQIYLFNKLN